MSIFDTIGNLFSSEDKEREIQAYKNRIAALEKEVAELKKLEDRRTYKGATFLKDNIKEEVEKVRKRKEEERRKEIMEELAASGKARKVPLQRKRVLRDKDGKPLHPKRRVIKVKTDRNPNPAVYTHKVRTYTATSRGESNTQNNRRESKKPYNNDDNYEYKNTKKHKRKKHDR